MIYLVRRPIHPIISIAMSHGGQMASSGTVTISFTSPTSTLETFTTSKSTLQTTPPLATITLIWPFPYSILHALPSRKVNNNIFSHGWNLTNPIFLIRRCKRFRSCADNSKCYCFGRRVSSRIPMGRRRRWMGTGIRWATCRASKVLFLCIEGKRDMMNPFGDGRTKHIHYFVWQSSNCHQTPINVERWMLAESFISPQTVTVSRLEQCSCRLDIAICRILRFFVHGGDCYWENFFIYLWLYWIAGCLLHNLANERW